MRLFVYTVDEKTFEKEMRDKNGNGKIISGLVTNMIHPMKLFSFAEKLVEIVKNEESNVYVNTYNDILVEAIEVLSVKHKIENNTRFYMNTPENKDIKEIYYSDIVKMYSALGQYDEINRTRIRNELRC